MPKKNPKKPTPKVEYWDQTTCSGHPESFWENSKKTEFSVLNYETNTNDGVVRLEINSIGDYTQNQDFLKQNFGKNSWGRRALPPLSADGAQMSTEPELKWISLV